MYQHYIVEIQQYANGEFGHIVHFAYDADADKARLKAESKYHEVLAAAAISALPSHAAILFTTEGFPLLHQCYKHAVEEEQAEEEPEEEPAEEEPVEEEPAEPAEPADDQ